jgi:hypothetical protein
LSYDLTNLQYFQSEKKKNWQHEEAKIAIKECNSSLFYKLYLCQNVAMISFKIKISLFVHEEATFVVCFVNLCSLVWLITTNRFADAKRYELYEINETCWQNKFLLFFE